MTATAKLQRLLADARRLHHEITTNPSNPKICGITSDVKRLATKIRQGHPELIERIRDHVFSIGHAATLIMAAPIDDRLATFASVQPQLKAGCEELDAFLTPPTAAKTVTPSEVDGPNYPRNFRWQGRDYPIDPIPWRVLKAAWGSPRIAQDALEAFVWGEGVAITSASLKAAVHRANAVLLEAESRLQLHTGAGEVFWSGLEVSNPVTF